MRALTEAWTDVKKQCPDSLILIRTGDFYETAHDDAAPLAKAIGLSITTQQATNAAPVPMAGFPSHMLDGVLAKLVKAGFRVALVEQVTDPQEKPRGPLRQNRRTITPSR